MLSALLGSSQPQVGVLCVPRVMPASTSRQQVLRHVTCVQKGSLLAMARALPVKRVQLVRLHMHRVPLHVDSVKPENLVIKLHLYHASRALQECLLCKGLVHAANANQGSLQTKLTVLLAQNAQKGKSRLSRHPLHAQHAQQASMLKMGDSAQPAILGRPPLMELQHAPRKPRSPPQPQPLRLICSRPCAIDSRLAIGPMAIPGFSRHRRAHVRPPKPQGATAQPCGASCHAEHPKLGKPRMRLRDTGDGASG